MPLNVAVMFAVPKPTLLASPALLIVAADVVSELQVAVEVRSCVVPSVKLPVAVNACCVPNAIVALPGVTAIDTSAAALTVSVVDPWIVLCVAVMFAAPVATLAAIPWLPLLLLIVATAGLSELHCTVPVMSCVLPSVNVPVAENCFVVPSGITGIAGVTAIDTRVAGLTVSVVVPLIEPNVALTLVLPTAALVASPWLFTVAMAELAVLQVTELVTSSVLPSV